MRVIESKDTVYQVKGTAFEGQLIVFEKRGNLSEFQVTIKRQKDYSDKFDCTWMPTDYLKIEWLHSKKNVTYQEIKEEYLNA